MLPAAPDRLLFDQLNQVAAEAAKNNYFMSERCDMDHVYYIDGKDAHGSEKYYEYPNVFAAVLIGDDLGLTIPAGADVAIAPHLTGDGTVEFDTPEYALRYTLNHNGFALRNLSGRARRCDVDLSALGIATHYRLKSPSQSGIVTGHTSLTLSPHEQALWTPLQQQ